MAVSKIANIGMDKHIPSWEYVGTVNGIHWNSWTCPNNGFVIADIGLLVNDKAWYYYISDTTSNRAVGKIAGSKADGTYRTIFFPVEKGKTYRQTQFANVDGARLTFSYYKFI